MRLTTYCFSALLFSSLISPSVEAQVVPDNSLGLESSIAVPIRAGREDITGGAIRGENLFHSFESFNLSEGTEAYFISPNGISHIFSRVTGSDVSEVLGKLGASTDLFFLNSNGILFGPNASLDINGSLILSTADSIEFPGGVFNSDLGVESSLSTERPVGLNLTASGLIQIEGQGRDPSPPLPPSTLVSAPLQLSSDPGLSLSPQNTLALVANEIDLNGGIIRTVDGRVILAGLSGQARVSPDKFGWNLGLESGDVSELGNIQIRGGGTVEATGTLSGQIDVIARDISIINGGILLSANYGGSNFSGGIDLVADNLTIGDNTLPPRAVNDDLISQSINGGEGGDIVLSVSSLRIADGGQVISTAADSASSGEVKINASNSVVLDGVDPLVITLASAVNSVTYGAGDAGGIMIETPLLQILDGGIVSTSTVGAGDAGDVTITSDDIEIEGFMPFILRPSFAGSITTGTGNSGELNIRTQRLEMSNGGTAGTSNLGSTGDAGDAFFQASESIQISGQIDSALSDIPSSIISNSTLTPEIAREVLEIDDTLLGESGNLFIDTPILSLQAGGFVGVQNEGTTGSAGSVLINTDELKIINGSSIGAFTAGGQGGNIQIFSEDILLADRSSINAAAAGAGDGGSILIDSQVIGAFRDSRISANAELGRGGNVTLISTGLFQDDSSTITATSTRGPQFNGVVNITSPDPSLEENSALPVTVVQYPELPLACRTNAGGQTNSLTISGRGGIRDNARGSLRNYSGWNFQAQERGSLPEPATISPSSQAQGWIANSDGTYSMVSEVPHFQSSANSAEDCLTDFSG